MSTVDRRIDRHIPVNVARGISFSENMCEHTVPGAICCVAAMPFPHRLPGTIPVREITPRDPGPVPVDDALYNAAVVTEGAAFAALIRWQEWLDSFPLCIRELRKSRPLRHNSMMTQTQNHIKETHPSHLLAGKDDRHVRKYHQEFRDDIVRVALNRDSDVKLAQIAKDVGIHVATLDI